MAKVPARMGEMNVRMGMVLVPDGLAERSVDENDE
jgi:hypothetical protein